jgi:hypothetical protein
MLSLRTLAVLLFTVASAMAQVAPTKTIVQNVGASNDLTELAAVSTLILKANATFLLCGEAVF